jgi:hypothetical protein
MYLETPQHVFLFHIKPRLSHHCQGNNKGDSGPSLDVGGGVAAVRLAVGECVASILKEVVINTAASGVRLDVIYSFRKFHFTSSNYKNDCLQQLDDRLSSRFMEVSMKNPVLLTVLAPKTPFVKGATRRYFPLHFNVSGT